VPPSFLSYLAIVFRQVIKKHRDIWPAGTNAPAVIKAAPARRPTVNSTTGIPAVFERATATFGRRMSLSSPDRPPVIKGLFFGGSPVDSPYEAADGPALVIDGLPLPVYHCLEALKDQTAGLFESSGSVSEVTRLKQSFDRGTRNATACRSLAHSLTHSLELVIAGEVPNMQKLNSCHSVVGVLEAYFRELPEPITTFLLYEKFMSAGAPQLTNDERITQLQAVVQQLPAINWSILDRLLALLHTVRRYSLLLSLSLSCLLGCAASIMITHAHSRRTRKHKTKARFATLASCSRRCCSAIAMTRSPRCAQLSCASRS